MLLLFFSEYSDLYLHDLIFIHWYFSTNNIIMMIINLIWEIPN